MHKPIRRIMHVVKEINITAYGSESPKTFKSFASMVHARGWPPPRVRASSAPPQFRQVEGLVDAALLARTLVVRFRSRTREC